MIDGGTPRLSVDELTIYFFTSSPGDLWFAHRDTLTDAFGAPMLLTMQNSSSYDSDPAISTDGLRLWFASNRMPNAGTHLYIATRTSTLAEFSPPGLATAVNASTITDSDIQPSETIDANELWFTSTRTGGMGGYDIWRSLKSSSGFGTPMPVIELNSSSDDWLPTLSADRLSVYFSSKRATIGTKGGYDIWTSHRRTINESFPRPTLVDELNTGGGDFVTWLSADNCRAYGVSYASGPGRYFIATR